MGRGSTPDLVDCGQGLFADQRHPRQLYRGRRHRDRLRQQDPALAVRFPLLALRITMTYDTINNDVTMAGGVGAPQDDPVGRDDPMTQRRLNCRAKVVQHCAIQF